MTGDELAAFRGKKKPGRWALLPKHWSVVALANYLGVCESWVLERCRKGVLPTTRLNGRFQIKPEAVEVAQQLLGRRARK